MKALIVNADDFGIHPDVNHAVIKAYQTGILRSTSLMATGRAFAEAATLAHEHPALGVAVHVTLVAEKPVLDPKRIPSLVNAEGYFLPNHVAFIKRFLMGGIRFDELRAEIEAQIKKVLQAGVHVTHLDSHQHLHVLPHVIDICLDLMQAHGIHKMRLPAEAYGFRGGYHAGMGRYLAKCGLTFCAQLAARKARRRGIIMPHAFFGMLAGGHMTLENLLPILQVLPEGTSEIMMHPGMDNTTLAMAYDWGYHWQQELAAMTSPVARQFIATQGIRLISFKELS